MNVIKTGILALSLSAAFALPALAADSPTKEQCEAWFVKADVNKDGSLGGDELKEYADRMGLTATNKDLSGTIVTKVDWSAACEAGKFGMPQ